ncbi:type II toxin-antitoxin system VapC family toxin [uncultured Sphingomonas sp.]|uniref:type II toxin-antitoxin system VapC family toxin n=1 Tax=uncultured Sphingomonas sp. TaxID=158754 RepID=UPI0035CAA665
MKLLLDTQMLILLMTDRRQLANSEDAAIKDAEDLIVSTLSLMELRIKARAERRRGLTPSIPLPVDAVAFCEGHRIVVHPLAPADTIVTLEDDPPHGDPFDELLLAHAQALQAKLLTRDNKLVRHPLAYQP